jgi:hypothetical protein
MFIGIAVFMFGAVLDEHGYVPAIGASVAVASLVIGLVGCIFVN